MFRRALPIILLVAITVCAAVVGGIASQLTRRATVATAGGDVISGDLRSVDEAQVVLEVAGQPLRIPIADIRYISFVGVLPSTNAAASGATVEPVRLALNAIESLREVTQVGVLREQYSQKLGETLPTVMAFIKDGEGWSDVRAALQHSTYHYQEPMQSVSAWSGASTDMTNAARWASYAAELAKDPRGKEHIEVAEVRPFPVGQTITGRLGVGDSLMPRELDRSSEGGLNDRYTIDVPTYATVTLELTCEPCRPHLSVVNSAGRQVEGDMGLRNVSRIMRRNMPAGTYTIWAGTVAGEVGVYTLTIGVAQSGR